MCKYKKPMKTPVLYITFDGICDSLGRSQVLPYLSGLSQLGYAVTILSCEKPKVYQAHKTLVQSIVEQNAMTWHNIAYFNKPPIIGPFLLKRKVAQKVEALHKQNPFKIIHCRSYLASMIGLQMKRKYQTKFVFDMRGFWADERVDGKVWNLKNPAFKLVYSFFKKQEKLLLKNADYIVSLTQNAKDELHQRKNIGGENLPIKVIPCCADLEHFNPQKINQQKQAEYRKALHIDASDFVLTYLGSIGTWYMLDEMLDFFKQLLKTKPKAKFLFISKEKEKIQQLCQQKEIPLQNIIVQAVLYDDVPVLLSLSSVALFFILPVFSKKASSPIKQGEIMAMQIPIICNSGVGDTDYIIQGNKAGILLNEFNEKAYEKAIQQYFTSSFDTQNIRKGAEKHYSLAKGVEAYHSVYQMVLS